jgi:hypothetical protein
MCSKVLGYGDIVWYICSIVLGYGDIQSGPCVPLFWDRVTYSLVHMYICVSVSEEAAASVIWMSVVIQTSNHACKFFGCLTF